MTNTKDKRYGGRSIEGLDPINVELGIEIRTLREEKGMNQFEVADAVGINRVSMSKIESGRQNISYSLATRIREAIEKFERKVCDTCGQVIKNSPSSGAEGSGL